VGQGVSSEWASSGNFFGERSPSASYSPECVEGDFSEVRIAPVRYGPLLGTGASPKIQARATAWLRSEAPSLTLTCLT
jgi:hypothetical protein